MISDSVDDVLPLLLGMVGPQLAGPFSLQSCVQVVVHFSVPKLVASNVAVRPGS